MSARRLTTDKIEALEREARRSELATILQFRPSQLKALMLTHANARAVVEAPAQRTVDRWARQTQVAMTEREIRDFVRVTQALQKEDACLLEQAKEHAAEVLGCEVPTADEFSAALVLPGPRRTRGRPHSQNLSKRDAIAAVSVYFESIGAHKEQAIALAQRWLNITVSRRVAKSAVFSFRQQSSAGELRLHALWAYATFKPGTTLRLPTAIDPAPRARRRKSELG